MYKQQMKNMETDTVLSGNRRNFRFKLHIFSRSKEKRGNCVGLISLHTNENINAIKLS